MSVDKVILYYIHDPMCSWCWAFRPVWTELQKQLPESMPIRNLLGGLAADSDVVMPLSLQQDIQRHWQTIQKRVPGTMFNFDFWTQCQPRRSTWPACRAVIAAKKQFPNKEDAMIQVIQNAYYLEARNPSNHEVLIDLAAMIDLDIDQFRMDLHAADAQSQLLDHIRVGRSLGANGFPSLVLQKGAMNHSISVDYNRVEAMLIKIELLC